MTQKTLICLRHIFFNQDELHKCIHWSDENKQCKGTYDKSLFISPDSIWLDCKGFANMQLCACFAYKNFSKSDIKRFREYIRTKVMVIDTKKEE